jgi:thiamine-monophosphate kinase
MMDLSDGLAKDLPRLAEASGCGFELDFDALPKNAGCGVEQALGDGEDYELLLAIAPEQLAGLAAAWARVFPELELTAIGRLVEHGKGISLHGGWDHFASS